MPVSTKGFQKGNLEKKRVRTGKHYSSPINEKRKRNSVKKGGSASGKGTSRDEQELRFPEALY